MVKNFMTSILMPFFMSLSLLFAFVHNAQAATLTANVDRKQITENDSFRLFLRFDEQVGFGQPDLTELKRNFRVINQQRSNQFRSMNGKTVSFTEWTLVLSPLRTGDLIIPAIEFNGEKSQAIKVSVNELPPSVKEQIAKEFFFDIEVDSTSTYVQAQVLYTEKLYYSVRHQEPSLSELKVTDAHVVPLGEVRQYSTAINGIPMGVYERRYAIFAEESGEMVIPGQKFSASVVNPNNNWSRGRPVSIVAEPIRIKVKATPANYPQAPWLPSPEIKVSDRWSKAFSEWQVGEPITRNISIDATGLSGSQLPNIALPVVEGLKYYPDQSEHQDKADTLGIQGSLQQSLAIVPTKSGRITLPEVRIPWWNIKSNKLEYAILPEKTVNVAPAAQSASFESSQQPVAPAAEVATTVTTTINQSSGYWILATLILLVTNLITAYLLWSKPSASKENEEVVIPKNSKEAFKALKAACQKNDAKAMRHHLREWASIEYQSIRLEQLGEKLQEPSLSLAISELDSYLYKNTDNSAFNGQTLWNSLNQALRAKKTRESETTSELKPLY